MSPLDRRTFIAAGVATLVGCSSTRSGGTDGTVLRPVPGGTIGTSHGAITSVAMVGDSITEGSADTLTTTLQRAGVENVRIDGKHSRRIEVGNGKGDIPVSGIVTVYRMLAEGVDPSAWVIELGTNDVGSYSTPEEYGTLIDKIIDMLPPKKLLVWVNTYRKQFLEATKVFNTVLEERITARGNAAVADWYSVASAADQSVLRSDNLHPNPNGQLALSLLVVQALQGL